MRGRDGIWGLAVLATDSYFAVISWGSTQNTKVEERNCLRTRESVVDLEVHLESVVGLEVD